MIEIIKNGDLTRLQKIVDFECSECGCEFRADKEEYRIDSQYNVCYYKVKCPCCNLYVYKSY